MTSDFNFYLNQQGIQGRKGDKGDQGFSPIITIYSNTETEYILQIENEDGIFLTPNLRNQITDAGGTYLRYLPDVGYVLTTPDVASESQYGVIRIATQAELEGSSEDTATSPAGVKDIIVSQINGSDNVIIDVDEETQKLSIELYNVALQSEVDELETKVTTNTNDISTLTTNLANEVSNRTSADNQLQSAINTEKSARETKDTELENGLAEKITASNILEGSNVKIERDGNDVTISATGGSEVTPYYAGEGLNLSVNNVFSLATETSETIENYIVHYPSDNIRISTDYILTNSTTTGEPDYLVGTEAFEFENAKFTLPITSITQLNSSLIVLEMEDQGETFCKVEVNNYNHFININTNRSYKTDVMSEILTGGEIITVHFVNDTVQVTITNTDGENIGFATCDIDAPSGEVEITKMLSSSGEYTTDLKKVKFQADGGSFGYYLASVSSTPAIATTSKLGLVKPDGTTVTVDEDGTIHAAGGGSGDVTAAGDNVFTGTNTFKGASNLRVASDSDYATVAAYSTDQLYINGTETQATEQLVLGTGYANTVLVGDKLYQRIWNSENSRYELAPVLNSTLIDNQTIKFDQGVLKADLSEIGDELNAVAGRVTTAEGKITTAEGNITTLQGDVTELDEKISELQLYKFPNMTIIGEPTINNGQVSNFSTSNYLQFPFQFSVLSRAWVLNGSFQTGSDVTTQQNIVDSLASIALAVRSGNMVVALSSNGTSFDIGEFTGTTTIAANTNYFFQLSFDGTETYLFKIGTDPSDLATDITITSSSPIAKSSLYISWTGHPFGGIVNLNKWDLTVGDILVWQGMDDVGIATRADLNLSNITSEGKQVIKDNAGLDDIEEALTLLNGGEGTLLSNKANIDLDNLSTTGQAVINNKANIDADNFSTTGLSTLSGVCMPSSKSVSFTVGSSGSTYTAPANGWFMAYGGGLTKLSLEGGSSIIYSSLGAVSSGWYRVYVPIQKDQTINLVYAGTTPSLMFVYAEGENN